MFNYFKNRILVIHIKTPNNNSYDNDMFRTDGNVGIVGIVRIVTVVYP